VPITPQEIESKQFTVGLRGYDQQEVTSFLHTVAADYKEALEATGGDGGAGAAVPAPAAAPSSGDPYAAMGEEVAAVLRSAREAAGEVRKQAEQEAEALLGKAREQGAEMESTAKRHLEEADASADATRKQADLEAAGVMERAKQDAEKLLQDAVARYEQLIRDEQSLGKRLRGVLGDIESSLSRIPPPEATGVDAPADGASNADSASTASSSND
jgi:cell division initiation protein